MKKYNKIKITEAQRIAFVVREKLAEKKKEEGKSKVDLTKLAKELASRKFGEKKAEDGER